MTEVKAIDVSERSVKDLVRIVSAFLPRVSTMGLATIGGGNEPHAVNINFVTDDNLDIYFVSDPASRHSLDIAANPRVAATAYVDFTGAHDIKGLQLHGICQPVDVFRFDTIWPLYRRKFPYAAPFEQYARHEQLFYRMEITWVRWIDNSVHFGYKLESDWPVEESL